MNQPERTDTFVIPPGAKKIAYKVDAKVPNCGIYEVRREDHTLGNPLRHELLRNPNVVFGAYQMPHPLSNDLLIRIQTNGKVTPHSAFRAAITNLNEEVRNIKDDFSSALTTYKNAKR